MDAKGIDPILVKLTRDEAIELELQLLGALSLLQQDGRILTEDDAPAIRDLLKALRIATFFGRTIALCGGTGWVPVATSGRQTCPGCPNCREPVVYG